MYRTRVSRNAEINPGWLELPLTGTNFHGPKPVQAAEVQLYFILYYIGIVHVFSCSNISRVLRNWFEEEAFVECSNFLLGIWQKQTEVIKFILPYKNGHTP